MSELKEDDYNLEFKTMGQMRPQNKPFTPGRSVSPGSGFAVANPSNKVLDSPSSNYMAT